MDQDKRRYAAYAISLAAYAAFAYLLDRSQTLWILSLYVVTFASFIWLYRSYKEAQYREMVWVAIAIRLLFIASIPGLSDDIYRYLWDGRLLANGIHPFENLPAFYAGNEAYQIPGITDELYQKLNSPNYFTIYPPFAQYIFSVAGWLFPNNIFAGIIVLRLFVYAAEAGIIFILPKVLRAYGIDRKRGLLYLFNPLVVLEFSGNLHLEVYFIAGILLTLYGWSPRYRPIMAGMGYTLAVATKLIPLILLPVTVLRRWQSKVWLFLLVFIVLMLALTYPLFGPQLGSGMFSSMSLYFQKFEFNASLYYVLREVGFVIRGFNIIHWAGPVLAVTTTLSILIYSGIASYKRQPLPLTYLWIYGLYVLQALTVHPWYALPLLAFSIFTRYNFAVVWTFFIFFTYANYGGGAYHEHLVIVAIEYVVTIGWMIWEIKTPSKK